MEQSSCNTKPFFTQRDKLRALLFARIGQWVPLPDVQALGIAQHGARFNELRRELEPQGYRIENKMEHGTDGVVRSWYMLTRPGIASQPTPEPPHKEIPWSERKPVVGLPLWDASR